MKSITHLETGLNFLARKRSNPRCEKRFEIRQSQWKIFPVQCDSFVEGQYCFDNIHPAVSPVKWITCLFVFHYLFIPKREYWRYNQYQKFWAIKNGRAQHISVTKMRWIEMLLEVNVFVWVFLRVPTIFCFHAIFWLRKYHLFNLLLT